MIGKKNKNKDSNKPRPQLSLHVKAARSAFVCGILDIALAGALPPLAVAAIIASCVLKSKPLGRDYEFMRKRALVAGIIALIMFGIDIGIYCFIKAKIS